MDTGTVQFQAEQDPADICCAGGYAIAVGANLVFPTFGESSETEQTDADGIVDEASLSFIVNEDVLRWVNR